MSVPKKGHQKECGDVLDVQLGGWFWCVQYPHNGLLLPTLVWDLPEESPLQARPHQPVLHIKKNPSLRHRLEREHRLARQYDQTPPPPKCPYPRKDTRALVRYGKPRRR